MRRFNGCVLLTVLLLLWTATTVIGATLYYVTSEHAELKSAGSSTSSTLLELDRGAALSLIGQEGRWLEVATQDNQIGWIYRGKVSREQPEIEPFDTDTGGLGDLLGGISDSDIRADAADASRSIRGLSPEAKAYAQAAGTPQQSQNALERMLSRAVTEDRINAFLQEGKVGEFAGETDR